MRFLTLMRWLPFCLLTSCTMLGLGPKGLNLAPKDQARMERLLVDREYVLASTVTGAEFFGQTDKYFVDARPFQIISLERHNGDVAPIRMVTKMTLPAGTPVVLKEIIYPFGALEGAIDESRDPHELAPTAHTWLVVENTSPEGVTTNLVMVLPKDIENAAAFEKSVRARLVSPMWVSTWLSHRSPEVLNAIYQKNVLEGMSRAEVTAALGDPKNLADADGDAMSFEANYGDLQIMFEGSIVNGVRSLKVEAEIARLAAQERAKEAAIAAQEQRRVEEELAAQKALEDAEKEKAQAEAEKRHAEKLAIIEKERQAAVAAAQEARRARVIKAAAATEAIATPAKVTPAKVTPAKVTPKAVPAPRTPRRTTAVAPQKVARKPVRIDLDSEATAPAIEEAPETPRVAPFILGARVKALTKEKAKELGIRASGALVIHIRARGAALRMGLRNNDVIVGVNNKRVRKYDDLVKHLKGLTAQDAVTFKVIREGKTLKLETKQ